ncbi:hypothetical protein ACFXEL_03920 [Streptomyces sp. NPDC059382]|uniref:hypothetical protein n=1 Tax=Streptomyces sp. NPDC059382 TaxID=3346816 RepID=UPI0036BFCDF8
MTRTPDVATLDVATLDLATLASPGAHRLIATLPNQGPADVRSNLPRPTAAVLRHLADDLDTERLLAVLPAGRRGRAFARSAGPADAGEPRTEGPVSTVTCRVTQRAPGAPRSRALPLRRPPPPL